MAMQFWFEFGSTYSYPAAMRVEALARAQGVPLLFKPFLLGPIFREQGWTDSPFNLFPAKGRYMWRDLERLCQKYEIRFQRPSAFPRNGLLAARICCAASSEPWLPEFVRSIYQANFAEDLDISDAAVVERSPREVGQAGSEWLELVGAQENKDLLRIQTEEASRLGIFGAPTFVVGTEFFWGNDRLEDALAWYKSHPG